MRLNTKTLARLVLIFSLLHIGHATATNKFPTGSCGALMDRRERSLASARLALLESVGFGLGLMEGNRTRGRRPDRIAEAYPELQTIFQKLVIERAKYS